MNQMMPERCIPYIPEEPKAMSKLATATQPWRSHASPATLLEIPESRVHFAPFHTQRSSDGRRGAAVLRQSSAKCGLCQEKQKKHLLHRCFLLSGF